MSINHVLTHSLSFQKGNRYHRMFSSSLPLHTSSSTFSHSNVLSQDTLETATKTFLIKVHHEENPTKRLYKIDQIFRSGRMKDLHDNNYVDYYSLHNDKGIFKKRLSGIRKDSMKDKIEKMSKEMSGDYSRELKGNKRTFSYEDLGYGRDLTNFLSTSPTNYKRGLVVLNRKKESKENKGNYKGKGIAKGNKGKGGCNEGVFGKVQWKEIPKIKIQGYGNGSYLRMLKNK